MKKLLFLLMICWMYLPTLQAGIGMNSSQISKHYNLQLSSTDTIIKLDNIRLFYDAEKDIVYEQWVKIIPYRASEFIQLLKNEYPKADELGWFQYSENIIVCVRLDMNNMRDYYIHLKLINC